MGQPAHYTLDILDRCSHLIDHLLPRVAEGLEGDQKFGGPLTTTFLLAMATPMITLPLERILRPLEGKDRVANDLALNDGLSDAVRAHFADGATFGDASFAAKLDWRLATVPPFNIADWNGARHFEALNSLRAKREADRAPTKFMMDHLRNALAHGGIVYLNADGQVSGGKAELLGFVSADRPRNFKKFYISRVSEADFQAFLLGWAEWVRAAGVTHALNVTPPMAA